MLAAVKQLETETLAGIVQAKLALAELLERLAARQLDLAQQGELTDLIKLLAAKQTVLGQLSQIERQLDHFRSQDPESRAWRSPADRHRCQQQARRCDELLAETMRLEKEGEVALALRRNRAAELLAQTSAAGEAQAAYAQQPIAPSPAMHLHWEG
jgi:hypothetical protein